MYCLFYNKSLVQSKTAAVFYTKSQEQSANKTEQPSCFTKDYTNISILVELALSVALTPSFQKVTRVWSSRERNNLLNLKRLHGTQYILNRYDLIFIQKTLISSFLHVSVKIHWHRQRRKVELLDMSSMRTYLFDERPPIKVIQLLLENRYSLFEIKW